MVPPESELIVQPDRLPAELRQVLTRAESSGRAWFAWMQGDQVTAVSADVNEDGSRRHARPVLQVFLHDVNGRVIGSSGWLEIRLNCWAACEIS